MGRGEVAQQGELRGQRPGGGKRQCLASAAVMGSNGAGVAGTVGNPGRGREGRPCPHRSTPWSAPSPGECGLWAWLCLGGHQGICGFNSPGHRPTGSEPYLEKGWAESRPMILGPDFAFLSRIVLWEVGALSGLLCPSQESCQQTPHPGQGETRGGSARPGEHGESTAGACLHACVSHCPAPGPVSICSGQTWAPQAEGLALGQVWRQEHDAVPIPGPLAAPPSVGGGRCPAGA